MASAPKEQQPGILGWIDVSLADRERDASFAGGISNAA